jgi:mannosyl-3-phosphoglycerate phosphatase
MGVNSTPLVIITDLDGTLLDQHTYSYEASLPAIRRVQSLEVPLILCSSKTRSEIEPLWKELKLKDPFIVENGGAIYFLPDYFPFPVENSKTKGELHSLELGHRIDSIRRALAEASYRLHVNLQSFGEMKVEEICELTGLSKDNARAATKREYDEPFVLKQGHPARLFTALRTKGFKITLGDRFYHLSWGSDKGKATKTLLDLFRRVNLSFRSIGLGNSANDLPFLREVDRAILIRNPDRTWDSTITQNIAGIEKTLAIGPAGWREAVEKIFAD